MLVGGGTIDSVHVMALGRSAKVLWVGHCCEKEKKHYLLDAVMIQSSQQERYLFPSSC